MRRKNTELFYYVKISCQAGSISYPTMSQYFFTSPSLHLKLEKKKMKEKNHLENKSERDLNTKENRLKKSYEKVKKKVISEMRINEANN